MAHFRGTIQGQRGSASRLGSAKSGLHARLGSWQGGIVASLYEYTDPNGTTRDCVRIAFCQWDNGAVSDRELYDGPIAGHP